jgi:putative transposase
VTFSCFKRLRLLDDPRAKGIVIHYLADELAKQEGRCAGFVIMPDHVHALLGFNRKKLISRFMKQWKQRSSIQLKRLFREHLPEYTGKIDLDGPMWQPRYYDFNVYSEEKAREKLGYMHSNPVRAGLVEHAEDWPFGSARWYILKRSVGVAIEGCGSPLALRARTTSCPCHPWFKALYTVQ